MVQSWRDLLFLHWRWDRDELQAGLPRGLYVDTFEGQAWLGLVPFRMLGVRPRFLPPIPGHSAFLELNVRTYVHDEKGTPGVWFYSLDAERALAVYAARLFYGLPYFRARMSSRWDMNGFIEYGCRRRASAAPAAWFRYRGSGAARDAAPGSLAFFLVERYVLFALKRGRVRQARVHHAPYALEDAEVSQWSSGPLVLDRFVPPRREPDSALYSPGVDVRVSPLR